MSSIEPVAVELGKYFTRYLSAGQHQLRMLLQKHLRHFWEIVLRRNVNRFLSLVVGRVYVCAQIQKQSTHLQLARRRTQVQRRLFPQSEDIDYSVVVVN